MAQAVNPPSGDQNNKSVPSPRVLQDRETHQSITAWSVSVKNFYRRDSIYYPFVNPNTKWNSQSDFYGMVDEHADSKLKRKAEEMGEDLFAFLQIVAGYISGDHLRVKIEQDSTCFADIINIVREFYDAEINTNSNLDFMSITMKPQEPHRQFFERLSAHVREHLVPKDKKVGNISKK